MVFQLFSTAFSDGGWIPALHTCQGADLSPALEWSGEPGGTRSFALIVEDPDAPAGTWNQLSVVRHPGENPQPGAGHEAWNRGSERPKRFRPGRLQWALPA
jgi:hypothetical protein